MSGKKKKLSDRHLKFIDEYMRDLNATAAYIRTYPKTTYNSARAAASALLTNLNIREEINERFKARHMGSEEIVARLSDMARATQHSFIEIDQDGFVYFDFSSPEAKDHLYLIKKIKSKRNRMIVGKGDNAETWEGEWVEVELHDSKDALDKLAKIQKLYEDPDGDNKKFTAPQVVEIIKTYEKDREE